MNEPLLIGTRGWEHAAWNDSFYPPELPEDWRFCFYSNNLRSALVPQEIWPAITAASVAQWLEDSDPEFRFVLELPAELGRPHNHHRRDQELEAFLERVAPLAPRTAGLLLRVLPEAAVYPDWFEHLLARLGEVAPLCVDLPAGAWHAPEPLAMLERQAAGLVWHCAQEPAPRAGGRLLVALAPPAEARSVRSWIERLGEWQGARGETRAGLFFDGQAGAARAAQEARLIAELMGV